MATEREMGIGEKEEVFSSCKDRHFSPNVLYVREDPSSSSSFPAIWLHLLCSHSHLSSMSPQTLSVSPDYAGRQVGNRGGKRKGWTPV